MSPYASVSALALIFAFAHFAAAQSAAVSADEGVLLLRNGHLLRGTITPLGDHYLVTTGAGNEVRLPATSVEMACRSLEEAYQVKRSAIPYG